MVGTTRFVLTLAVMRLSQSAWQVSRFSATNWIKSCACEAAMRRCLSAWQFSSDPLGSRLRLIACRRLPSRCVPFLHSTPPSFVTVGVFLSLYLCAFAGNHEALEWVYLGLRRQNCFLSTTACKLKVSSVTPDSTFAIRLWPILSKTFFRVTCTLNFMGNFFRRSWAWSKNITS